jgi:BlaI family transcriptional regulator, penicillinase repressor
MFKGSWVASWLRGERDPVQAALGRLEREVMDVVWTTQGQPAHTVRDVQSRLPRKAAYTTVMTTLDRLFKKGLVLRRREGRAFVYTAARSREEMSATLTGGLLRGLLAHGPATARPFLSNLVDAVGEGDSALLDELERLVRDKQARQSETRKDSK